VDTRDLALVQGWSTTKATLLAWRRAPGRVLGPWVLVSLGVAVALLTATWLVALASTPDATLLAYPPGDPWYVVARNMLVLALHSLACLAGFIAKSSLPLEAERYSGRWRRIHDRAGPAAIVFVAAATLFSLGTQAYALGGTLSTLSAQWAVAPGALLLAITPHAVPELIALFLPLAAWLVAARSEAWDELLAATLVTTALALPVVVAAAFVETEVTPEVLRALHFV
jgi:hypothetical protein